MHLTSLPKNERANALYEVNHIVVKEQCSGQRQKTKLDDFVVETACGAHRGISRNAKQQKNKTLLLYPCFDRMVNEQDNCYLL